MRHYFKLLIVLCCLQGYSQRIYRFDDSGKTATMDFDLVHTKLNLSFNFENQTVLGEAWINLKPHFLPKKELVLDAKKMDIDEVTVNKLKVNYENTGSHLKINLPNQFLMNEVFTVYVKYKGNPNNIKNEGSEAITDSKGLYFINPTQKTKNKPTQIWTQGEPECNSVWFPTIDKPNQKSSQEVYICVPKKFETLSNGLLISQQVNEKDGTRTDYWKQDLPHAPYLFFVGVGDFKILKHQWRNKEVNYYVEADYLKNANTLFKNTPEMLDYFSKLTGVDFPWSKYSQIIVRDYVSGAMENTTAVVHGESAMLSEGQLAEKNTWERVIAHELFHHWFGDLVTTESWANITVNESFANYSEYLWLHYKYGKDVADAHLKVERDQYLKGDNFDKHLVRYIHKTPNDVFDTVSYNKGGLILHMLRNYLGDEIFFKGLNNYLTKNMFKTGEAHQLRIALEEVSGQDLMWFFSQWYYNNGHPKLKIEYKNDLVAKKIAVTITQSGKEFDFPIEFEVVEANKVSKHSFFVTKGVSQFDIPYKEIPQVIIPNSNHVLLAQIETPKYSIEELITMYQYTKHYEDKLYALENLKELQDVKSVSEVFIQAMDDSIEDIQRFSIENYKSKHNKKTFVDKLLILSNHPSLLVQASVIKALGKLNEKSYVTLFENKVKITSSELKQNAISAIYNLDKNKAKSMVSLMDEATKDELFVAVLKIYLEDINEEHMMFIAKHLLAGMYFSNDENLESSIGKSLETILKTNQTEAVQTIVDDFVSNGIKYKKYQNFYLGCVSILKSMYQIQENSNNTNKKEHTQIIQKGIEELIK